MHISFAKGMKMCWDAGKSRIDKYYTLLSLLIMGHR